MSQVFEQQPVQEPRLKGIGGWLILMSIGQVLGPIQILRGMIEEYSGLPEGTVAIYPAAMLGDVVIRLAFIGFLVYTAFLFFDKRAAFQNRFIQTYVAGLLLPFVIGARVTITTASIHWPISPPPSSSGLTRRPWRSVASGSLMC